MKKFLAIAAVSVLTLSACGGSNDKNNVPGKPISMADFLVDVGCSTAKYDGKVPEAEQKAISAKYGFKDDEAIKTALKAAVPNKDAIEAEAVPKIVAKCNDDFVKGGVDPKGFLDMLFQ
ncbi:MAG: hypothetical protein NTZ25_02810 [Candidatus Peregrinibacteria bacterium]|nr:hypothetical protein [Candidatus Peregrinibacteria bacterium]